VKKIEVLYIYMKTAYEMKGRRRGGEEGSITEG
jgi:hypothetical protein